MAIDPRVQKVWSDLKTVRDGEVARIDALVTSAEAHTLVAIERHDSGDTKGARAALKHALDAEYDAFGDCDAVGTLAELLYPEEDSTDWGG